jgi:hypothetical protein
MKHSCILFTQEDEKQPTRSSFILHRSSFIVHRSYFIVIYAYLLTSLITIPAAAQVTIGGPTPPVQGAILDLNSTAKGGLILSNVALSNLEKIPTGVNLFPGIQAGVNDDSNSDFTGAVVYNTTYVNSQSIYPGLYVWDGEKWGWLSDGPVPPAPHLETCSADYYPHDASKFVDIEVDADGTGPNTAKRTLRFLTYNLGADPNLSPKQQMAYSGADSTDVSVYGGLYQWGREDEPHSLRCDYTSPNDIFFQNVPYSSYDPATDTKYVIYGNGINWFSGSLADQAIFWGNGRGDTDQTTGNLAGSHNPCPAGFRIPTQYEWALLGKENGNSYSVSGDNFNTTGDANGTEAPSGIVWVRVANGKASASWSSGKLCGYALYEKSEWNTALSNWSNDATDQDLTTPAAPDPLLFLPAAGSRRYETGRVTNTGLIGIYSSSTITFVGSDHSRYLGIYPRSVTVDGGSARGNGDSIRCLAE